VEGGRTAVKTYHSVLDISGLTPYSNWTRAPLWWGFIGLVTIEATVFASFIVSYFYLKTGASGGWPPAPLDSPDLLLPTVNTAVLIASSFVVHWGDTGIKKGNRKRLRVAMLVAIAMAVTFLVLKVVEYADKSYRWDDHAYGSMIWVMIGFHSAHVFTVVLKTIIVDVLAWRGYFNEHRNLGVGVNGVYWHFVVIIWIPLYLTIYWAPRLWP
jgi:cytochrome c oxidase subunit III